LRNSILLAIITDHLNAAYVQTEQCPGEDSSYYKGVLDGLSAVKDDIQSTMRFEQQIKNTRKTLPKPKPKPKP
jgi:hypothetical protein